MVEIGTLSEVVIFVMKNIGQVGCKPPWILKQYHWNKKKLHKHTEYH